MKIGTDAVLLASLTDTEGVASVLDIGCGCGVIGFCIAQKLSDSQNAPVVFGIDPDKASIAEALRNAARFPLLPQECFHFENICLQDFVKVNETRKFNLIVSNPPYFHNNLKPLNERRLQSKHGDHQLSFRELADGVEKLLSPDGRFVLILPPPEMEKFHALTLDKWHIRKSVNIRPTTSKTICRVVREYTRETHEESTQTLIIREQGSHYTTAYLNTVNSYLTIC